MGSSKKGKHGAAMRTQTHAATTTPRTDMAKSKSAPLDDNVTPVKPPQISDAAKGSGQEDAVTPGATAEDGEAEPPTREEELAALPSLRAVTGVESDVENFKDILLWALKSSIAKGAVFDECTSAEKVDECTLVAWEIIKSSIKADEEGIDIETAIPEGRRALVANRSRNHKLGFDGTYTLSVSMQYDEYVASCLKSCFGLIISPEDIESFDYECPIPRSLFTAGVLEQFTERVGVNATPRFDYAYRNSTVYSFKVQSSAQEALILKMGGITLGKVGTFPFKPAVTRTTMEEMFVLGTTGVGSAREDLRPAVAGAISCSSNKVKVHDESPSVKSAFKVIKVVYPYSRIRYDAVTRLFKQGHFQLVNPRVEKAKPLEIFVAPTLIELGYVAGVTLVKNNTLDLGGDEEEELKAIDLSPPSAPAE